MIQEYDKWFNVEFRDKCMKYDIEPIIDGDKKLVLVCAHTPDEKIQKDLLESVPAEQPHEFIERMKLVTVTMISFSLSQLNGVRVSPPPVLEKNKNNPRYFHLKVYGEIENDDPIWASIFKAFENDRYVDGYGIFVNDKKFRIWSRTVEAEVASHQGGNSITADDLLNLRIALETSTSVDDLLKNL
jgi:hypothetical protein